MIYILLSNDYEVFFGRNLLPETEVLCAPTERLLESLDTADAPMTFFCDVACLWRYSETGHGDFTVAVEDQLRRIVAAGHDVQAHIHPHWLSAEIHRDADGTSYYSIDLNDFGLAGAARNRDQSTRDFTRDIALRAKSYLENLLTPERADYSCIAFRAGGYCIQPGAEKIFSGLRQAGYLIDSSIVPGMRLESNVNRIDFTNLSGPANYWAKDVGHTGDGLYEIPVGACFIGSTALAGVTFRRMMKRRHEGAHRGGVVQLNDATNRAARLGVKLREVAGRIARGWDLLELKNDARYLVLLTRRFIDEHCGEDPLLFSFSCHSKAADDVKCRALEQYVDDLRSIYGDKIRFISFQDVPNIPGLMNTHLG